MRRMYSEKQIKELVKATKKDITTLVDSQGRNRFEEWNLPAGEVEGFTFVYGKASLCGTHLMFVVAGTVDNGTAITSGIELASLTLPEWIYDKIIPLYSNNVRFSTQGMYASGGTSQNVTIRLVKYSDNKVIIETASAVTLSANRNFAFVFDLLIDSD